MPRVGLSQVVVHSKIRSLFASSSASMVVPGTAWRSARTVLSLCPGPLAGVVVVFGLTPDDNGSTDFPIFRASRRTVDSSGSAGGPPMSADRVINSNAEVFNTGTWAGGAWQRNTVSEHGDIFEAATGGNAVRRSPSESELPRIPGSRNGAVRASRFSATLPPARPRAPLPPERERRMSAPRATGSRHR